MNSKTLAIVVGGAVVLAGAAALVVNRAHQATAVQQYGDAVFPGLSAKAGDVATVVVNAAGTTSTVQKQGNTWVLAEKGNYPVKIEKIKGLVVGLAQLKQLEPKTSRPDSYAKIGVEDPPSAPAPVPAPDPANPSAMPPEKSQAALVTLKDASGAVIASAVVGKQHLGTPPAVFVRKAGDAQSWLAEGQVEVPREVNGWIETQLINLSRDRIKSVTVTAPGGETSPLVVHRETKEQPGFSVEGIPSGATLKDAGAADPVATALSYLNFDDVLAASGVAPPDGVSPTTYEARTFDGMVVTCKLFAKDGKHWARFEAAVDEAALPKAPATPAPAPVDPAKPADPGTPDPAKLAADEAAKKAADVRKEVKDFNDRHGGWMYSIPEFKAKNMVTRLDELLAETPPSPGPQGPAVPSDPAVNPPPAPSDNPPPQPVPEPK